MIKIVHNNLIIDVCAGENYLRFLPHNKRFISVDFKSANAVMGSDNNTIYHILGTPYNFSEKIKTVQVFEISQEEYSSLILNNSRQEEPTLKEEIDSLKSMVTQQNLLIQQLLKKIT